MSIRTPNGKLSVLVRAVATTGADEDLVVGDEDAILAEVRRHLTADLLELTLERYEPELYEQERQPNRGRFRRSWSF